MGCMAMTLQSTPVKKRWCHKDERWLMQNPYQLGVFFSQSSLQWPFSEKSSALTSVSTLVYEPLGNRDSLPFSLLFFFSIYIYWVHIIYKTLGTKRTNSKVLFLHGSDILISYLSVCSQHLAHSRHLIVQSIKCFNGSVYSLSPPVLKKYINICIWYLHFRCK